MTEAEIIAQGLMPDDMRSKYLTVMNMLTKHCKFSPEQLHGVTHQAAIVFIASRFKRRRRRSRI